jgi:hypothetical protein
MVRPAEAVQIRFALMGESGACYKVEIGRNGTTLQGYLPQDAVTGTEQFEDARKSSAPLDGPATPPAQVRTAAAPASPQTALRHSLAGARFALYYDHRDVSVEHARVLMPVIDREFTRISEQLGCTAGDRMTVTIQSKQEYLRTTGAAEWSVGLFDGSIRVALIEPKPGAETERAFAHEIVHGCLVQLGSWPAWLHEGLAQRFSGEGSTLEERELVKKLMAQKALPPLAQLDGSWARLDGASARAAYATALVAAEMLYERIGLAGIRSLLQNPAMLPQLTSDVDRWLRQ